MAQKTFSLSHLLFLVLPVSSTFVNDGQVSVTTNGSSCKSVRSCTTSVEEDVETGLELLQLNSQARVLLHRRAIERKEMISLLAEPPPPACNHHLSGVDDSAVSAVLRKRTPSSPMESSGPLQALRQQKIFVVALLHQSDQVMPHWTVELLRLMMALRGAGNSSQLFVSVYESGSIDRTAEYLDNLRGHLDYIGIANSIVTGGLTSEGRQRIEFLADVRNRAMSPLWENTETYDRVLWLSDNFFCADGVLQMLAQALPEAAGGTGADAVCGMDYHFAAPECQFYDTWVSRDIEGLNFGNNKPYIRGPSTQGDNRKLEAGQPFQVFSCWNAMVVFNADVFQKERLSFRIARDDLKECGGAETELIFRDMWAIGRGKIVISPAAASAYLEDHFAACAVDKQPSQFDKTETITWLPEPEVVMCCPGQPQYCFPEKWNRFGRPPTVEVKGRA